MNARDELANILERGDLYYDTGSHYELATEDAADAILAAGYTKRETLTEYAAGFRKTGEIYNFHRTREEAQKFVDSLNAEGVDMIVMTRDEAVEAAVVAAAKVLYADKMSNHSGDNAPQIIDACERVARKMMQAAAPHLTAPLVRALEVERKRVELLLSLQRTPEDMARKPT